MGRLSGKRALVTAAANGIGRATVEAFAHEGAEVIGIDLEANGVPRIAGVTARRADLSSARDIRDLAAEIGVVDVLVNAVGWVHHGTLLDMDEDAWTRSFDLNVTSAFRMIRAFLPPMLAAGRGSIVNIASVASTVVAVPNRCAYGASKAALIGLTKSVAVDYVSSGVRCNAICPGTVESPSLRQRMEDTGDAEAARAQFVARQPMGRLGRPEEIAELCVYLASDLSAFTTGAVHVIDGGWTNA